MNYRSIISALFISAFCFVTFAEIHWIDKDFDFGLMKEIQGPQTGTARFVNDGPGPTYIRNVRTTCGCTKADFTDGIIEEGDTATVCFTYDPVGRPGKFSKTIKVFVGEDNRMHLIKISGTVIGSPETLATAYPYECGAIRFSDRIIPGGDVTYGDLKHYFVSLTNQSADTIRPAISAVDKCVNVALSPQTVPPGEMATAAISFNSREEKNPGRYEYVLTLVSDTESLFPEQTELSLNVNIQPDLLSIDSRSLDVAPVINISPAVIDLGHLKKGKQTTARFSIRNSGEDELVVKRITSSTPGVSAKRYPSRLAKGKKGDAEINIDSSALGEGVFRIQLEVVSNDPLHPVAEVRIAGERD